MAHSIHDLTTPALLIDTTAFEANLADVCEFHAIPHT